jgi:hypothetical protein
MASRAVWLACLTIDSGSSRRGGSPREELDRTQVLAADIPSLWNAADTPAADRKEIVRALIERVTVTMPGDAQNVGVRIQWIGGMSTEHAIRRPISRYERLSDFPRTRRLVEDAVAAGQSAAQFAEFLDREGFRPPSGRADRFTPGRARDLVYRLSLSSRQRPAESLVSTSGGFASWRTNWAWATTDSRNGPRRAMSMLVKSAAGGIW